MGLKAVKNSTEIQWVEKTMVKDGRAVVNFLHWLETCDDPVTELSAAHKMWEFRSAQEGFIDDSFDAIMAAQEHSAMCHYKAVPESDRPVTEGMFLTDSGGNYLTGTTDITRTVHLGPAGVQDKTDYTLVLKGHIAVALSRFPSGTRGYQDRHPRPAVPVAGRHGFWPRHGARGGIFPLCP